jgi:hypothetical protein
MILVLHPDIRASPFGQERQLIWGVGAMVLYTISAAASISSSDGKGNAAGEAGGKIITDVPIEEPSERTWVPARRRPVSGVQKHFARPAHSGLPDR